MSSVVSLLGEENALNDFKRIPTENKDKKPPAQGQAGPALGPNAPDHHTRPQVDSLISGDRKPARSNELAPLVGAPWGCGVCTGRWNRLHPRTSPG